MRSQQRARMRRFLYSFSTLWILLFIILVLAVMNPSFLRLSNLSTFVTQACFLFLLGAAELVVILTGGIDLSIGAVLTSSTIICGNLMTQKSGVPFIVPILLVLLICAAIGMCNGLLVTKLKIPAFLATFATMYICRGGAWLYIGAGVFFSLNSTLRFLATGELFSLGGFRVTMPMVIVLLLAILLHLLLKKTNWGKRLFFTGANRTAAKFTGIQPEFKIIQAHILCSVIAGIAAIMYVSKLNAIDATLGASYHFDGLTVALIGGAVMSGGEGSIFGVMMGALIVSAINSGLNFLAVPTELQKAVLGVAMIAAVFLNQFLQRKKLAVADAIFETSTEEKATK